MDEEGLDPSNPSVLSESVSITRIDDLMSQMRFREAPKRALFSVPFELGKDFTIGVKGFAVVIQPFTVLTLPFQIRFGNRAEEINLQVFSRQW